MKLPPNFRFVRPGLVAREGWESTAEGLLDAGSDTSSPGEVVVGGRGTARPITLPGGDRAWVRRYRHGGAFGGLLGQIYLGWQSRPLRELRATEAARAAGVLAPEVLVASTERWAGLFYRARIVSREIGGRRSLAEALRGENDPLIRERWLAGVVRDVLALHRAGVHHPDLNVTNLLAGELPEEPIAIIDFDRARVGSKPRGFVAGLLAWRRLVRSIAKLELVGLGRRELRRKLRSIVSGGTRGAAEKSPDLASLFVSPSDRSTARRDSGGDREIADDGDPASRGVRKRRR